MKRLALLVLLAACGHHAEVVVDGVGVERKPDGVEVTVWVASTGQNGWPADEEFCIVVDWKDTAKLAQTVTVPNEPYLGTPDANVPAIETVKQCVKQAIDKRARFILTSSKAVPKGSTVIAYLTVADPGRPNEGAPKIVRDYATRIESP
jgi:hypothetical protein